MGIEWRPPRGTQSRLPLSVESTHRLRGGGSSFLRHWLANDPRGRGGDGLGPLYNATLCVDCHREGGPGDAGTADRNVDVVTLIPGVTIASQKNLYDFHPGFQTAKSVVLHRYGTDTGYGAWRLRRVDGVEHAEMAEAGGDTERDMVRETVLKGGPSPRSLGRRLLDPRGPRVPNRVGGTVLLGQVAFLTQRNAPSLFGPGLIDAIPAEAMAEAARGATPGPAGG